MTFETMKQLISIAFREDFKLNCSDCTLVFRKGKHSHVIPIKLVSLTTGVYIDAFLYFRDDLPFKRRLSTYWNLKY